jgi:hypothetical protein
MAAQRVTKNVQTKFTLATTLTRLIPGDDVRWIEVSCDSDVYWVYDNAKADGDAITAASVHRIPANTMKNMPITGVRPLIASVSGTPTVTLFGFRE